MSALETRIHGGALLALVLTAAAASAAPKVAASAASPSAAISGSVALPAASAAASAAASPIQAAPALAAPAAGIPQPLAGGACEEHIPEGKARPLLKDTFPATGISGHHVTLEVEIEHGLGETVLPGALQIQTRSDAAKQLEALGFVFPDSKGPAHARITRTESGGTAKTKVSFPLLALPKKPGRNEMVLPALPIAMSRASGEVITLCTSPHTITVEDPTANSPNAQPKANPKALRQREFWTALRNATYGGVAALLMAALGYLAMRWWRRRPRTAPPPPPKRPAWDVALEALFDIQQARLVEQGRLEDHFDRVSNALRQYLGDRFGFDGLESTTREIVTHLNTAPEAAPFMTEVDVCLGEVDLVKFANVAPTEAQCHGLLDRSVQLVRRSIPTTMPSSVATESAPGTPLPSDGGAS
jgi:hypothetical protein